MLAPRPACAAPTRRASATRRARPTPRATPSDRGPAQATSSGDDDTAINLDATRLPRTLPSALWDAPLARRLPAAAKSFARRVSEGADELDAAAAELGVDLPADVAAEYLPRVAAALRARADADAAAVAAKAKKFELGKALYARGAYREVSVCGGGRAGGKQAGLSTCPHTHNSLLSLPLTTLPPAPADRKQHTHLSPPLISRSPPSPPPWTRKAPSPNSAATSPSGWPWPPRPPGTRRGPWPCTSS